MNEGREQYEVEPESFWAMTWAHDGYTVIDMAESVGWDSVGVWGAQGWNLGSWPYVVIFHRESKESCDLVTYVEGDITMYQCPTKEIRNQITDEIAFFYWKRRNEDFVAPYTSIEQLPDDLRGPYSRDR